MTEQAGLWAGRVGGSSVEVGKENKGFNELMLGSAGWWKFQT